MAKATLVAVLMLVSKTVTINKEEVKLKAGEVYDLDSKEAKALVKAGEADDTPANIAFHRGDLELFEQLRASGAAKQQAQVPAASGQLDLQDKNLSEEQRADLDKANELLKAAEQEQDPAKAEQLRQDAKALIDAAGLAE